MTYRSFQELAFGSIVPARPVSGGVAQSIARVALVAGRKGSVVVPCTVLKGSMSSGSRTVRLQLLHSGDGAVRRLWQAASGLDSDGVTAYTLTDPSGGVSPTFVEMFRDLGSDDPWRLTERHVETISSPTTGLVAGTVVLTYTGGAVGKTLQNLQLSCHELCAPPGTFDAGSPTIGDVGYGQPIRVASTDAVIAATSAAWEAGKSLFAFLTLGGSDAYSTTSGTYVTIVGATPVCVPSRTIGSTTETIRVYVYTRSDAATTGTVRFTAASGATATIAISAADAGTWRNTTLAVRTEDPTTADGWRTGTPDTVTVELIRNTGAGTVRVDSIQGFDLRV